MKKIIFLILLSLFLISLSFALEKSQMEMILEILPREEEIIEEIKEFPPPQITHYPKIARVLPEKGERVILTNPDGSEFTISILPKTVDFPLTTTISPVNKTTIGIFYPYPPNLVIVGNWIYQVKILNNILF